MEDEIRTLLDVKMSDISRNEVWKAVFITNSKQPPEADQIHAEILKYGGETLLHSLCIDIWKKGLIPEE